MCFTFYQNYIKYNAKIWYKEIWNPRPTLQIINKKRKSLFQQQNFLINLHFRVVKPQTWAGSHSHSPFRKSFRPYFRTSWKLCARTNSRKTWNSWPTLRESSSYTRAKESRGTRARWSFTIWGRTVARSTPDWCRSGRMLLLWILHFGEFWK